MSYYESESKERANKAIATFSVAGCQIKYVDVKGRQRGACLKVKVGGGEGREYIFEAKDQEDMWRWVDALLAVALDE